MEEIKPDATDPYATEMTEVEIDGYYYIGYISIPALGMELPVMSDWSYPQLNISPCRYAGSTKTDDLVIAGHNYTRHFGGIKNLSYMVRCERLKEDCTKVQSFLLYRKFHDYGTK